MNANRWAAALALLATTGMMSGCWGVWGWTETQPVHSARYRIEGELVPNAVLVREDTKPIEKGRLAFMPGTEQLLVLTRITSVALDPEYPDAAREDRYWERVWITIPMEAPLGAELDLAELEQYFALAYDLKVKQVGEEFFIYPSRVTGKVTLVERRENEAVVKLDALIAPRDVNKWRVTDTLTVPVTQTGIFATRAEEGQEFRYAPMMRQPPTTALFEKPASATEAGGDVQAPLTPMPPIPAHDPAIDQMAPNAGDANAADQAAGLDDAKPDPTRSIVGKWSTTSDNWNHRWQFFPDNTFVFAVTRGPDLPVVMRGRFDIRNDEYVILEYKDIYQVMPNGLHADRLRTMNPADARGVMKILWQDANLVLNGKGLWLPTVPPYRFKPAEFPDYRQIAPEPEVKIAPAPAEQPAAAGADGQAPDGEQAAPPPVSVAGKWFMRLDNWDHYYQFNPDGTLIFSKTRGLQPMVSEGTWSMRENVVIVNYTTLYELQEDGKRKDHWRFLEPYKTSAFQARSDQGNLVLEGRLAHDREPAVYTLTRDDWPDFRTTPPPFEVRPRK